MTTADKKRFYLLVALQLPVALLSLILDNGFLFLAGIVVCVALHSSALIIDWSMFSIIGPVASAIAVYFLSGSAYVAMMFGFYMPIGIVMAYCIRRGMSRSRIIMATSLSFAFSAFVCLTVYLLETCEVYSLNAFRFRLRTDISLIKSNILNEIETLLESQTTTTGIEIDTTMFTSLFADMLDYISFGMVALLINGASYLSSVFTKLALKGSDNERINKIFSGSGWRYVLSKSSAAIFAVIYLFIIIGGETLTLPQIIAFYSVILALSGGVIIMAINNIIDKIRKNRNFVLLIMLGAITFFFGGSAAILALFVIGLTAAFTFKIEEEA